MPAGPRIGAQVVVQPHDDVETPVALVDLTGRAAGEGDGQGVGGVVRLRRGRKTIQD